ncbi:LysE family translocator [Streptomyces sp. HC44]|uniref:LysE family translocator n=1 Tax=Streptomyces scabichelini TaxID=2711217 RepID=A0A6G4V2S6_9ACTN|nr:LysE family translocator [Streptomyces scabichelini]NGO08271.1 LysE family translocator [Streptomyces scabichelini]
MNWAAFFPSVLLVSLIPGASQVLGMRNAMRYGLASSLFGIGGRLAAFAVLIGLVVAGLGAIMASSTTTLVVIKWIGVVYLAWLGIRTLHQASRDLKDDALATSDDSNSKKNIRSIIVTEFFVAISNPKALLLFAALLPQFTATSTDEAPMQIAVLGAVYLLVEFLVGLLYVGVGSRLGVVGISVRNQHKVELASGVSFLGIAGLLAMDDVR